MVLINITHFLVVAVPIRSFDRPVSPFTQQHFRHPGITREDVAVGTFVLVRPYIESTASAVMQQSLHLKRKDYMYCAVSPF